MCEADNVPEDFNIDETMASTVELFHTLNAHWRTVGVRITSKHHIKEIFKMGGELTEDLDEQLKELHQCFDLYSKGFFSEACAKHQMTEEWRKASLVRLGAFHQNIDELAALGVSIGSLVPDPEEFQTSFAKLKEDVERKADDVKSLSGDVKSTLEKVRSYDAIVQHAEKVLKEAAEVEITLSAESPPSFIDNNNRVSEELRERRLLAQLSTLHEHYLRQKKQLSQFDLPLFDKVGEKHVAIETLVSLRKERTRHKKHSRAASSVISTMRNKVLQCEKAVDDLEAERVVNSAPTSTLFNSLEAVVGKILQVTKKVESLQSDVRYVNNTVDIQALLEKLSNLTSRLNLLRAELTQDKHRVEVVEKIDTFLHWLNEKTEMARQQLVVESSTGKTYLKKFSYLKFEIEKSACVHRILVEGGSAMSKRDPLFHEDVAAKLSQLNIQWKELEYFVEDNETMHDLTDVVDKKENHLLYIERWADTLMDQLGANNEVRSCSQSKSLLGDYNRMKLKVERYLEDANTLNDYFNNIYDMVADVKNAKQEIAGESSDENNNYSIFDENNNDIITKKIRDGGSIPVYSSLITASKATSVTTKVENLELFLAKKIFDVENDGLFQTFLMLCSIEDEWIVTHQNFVGKFKQGDTHSVVQHQQQQQQHGQNMLISFKLFSGEITRHEKIFKGTITFGKKCLNNDSANAEIITKEILKLQSAWETLSDVVVNQNESMESNLIITNTKEETNRLLCRINAKIAKISGLPVPNDLASCESSLRANKHNLLDMEHMRNKVKELLCTSNSALFKDPAIREKVKAVSTTFPSLDAASHGHSKQLRELHLLFSLYSEVEGFKLFMVELSKKLSSDDYGQNYEEVMRLIQRLENDMMGLRVGNEMLRRIGSFASAIMGKQYPHKAAVLIVQQKISAMWERLESKVRQRQKKLERARQFHSFNLSISNLMSSLNVYSQYIGGFDTFFSEDHTLIDLKSKHTNLLSLVENYSTVEEEICNLESKIESLTSKYPGKASQKLMSHTATLKKVHRDNATAAHNLLNNFQSKISSLEACSKKDTSAGQEWLDTMFSKLAKVKEMADDFMSTEQCVQILSS